MYSPLRRRPIRGNAAASPSSATANPSSVLRRCWRRLVGAGARDTFAGVVTRAPCGIDRIRRVSIVIARGFPVGLFAATRGRIIRASGYKQGGERDIQDKSCLHGFDPPLIAVPGQSRTTTTLYASALPLSAITNPGQAVKFKGRHKSATKSILPIMQSIPWLRQDTVRLRKITMRRIHLLKQS
jgi:hypothetical protein